MSIRISRRLVLRHDQVTPTPGALVVFIAALGVLFASAGCTTDSNDMFGTGSLGVALELLDGNDVDEVQWQITGGGMMPMAGTIDTSASGTTASVEVFGIPPGDGYLVSLSATSTDGSTSCNGSAPFGIAAGETTDVHVMIRCKTVPDRGAVRVEGSFKGCAELTKVIVSPLQTSIGNQITLSAAAADPEGNTVAFRWSATGGTIADPASTDTQFTCEEDGDHSVTVEVSDDDFVGCVADWTVAIRCVDGGGTGGTGGGDGFPAAPEPVGGVSMLGVTDPLNGNRVLEQQDDLVISVVVGDSPMPPTFYAIPTSDGGPEGAVEQTLGMKVEPNARTVKARLFNTARDYLVSLRPELSSDVTLEALEWSTTGTIPSFEPVFSQAVKFPDTLTRIVSAVDDFNRDGLDDILVAGVNVPKDFRVITAMDVDEPGTLQVNPVGDSTFGDLPGELVSGDLNGDGLLEVVQVTDCKNSATVGPADNFCRLEWQTICPAPIPNTVCADAPSGWTFAAAGTGNLTVSVPSGWALAAFNLARVAVGDVMGLGTDQIAVVLPLVKGDTEFDDGVVGGDDFAVELTIYSFSETFEPTQLAVEDVWSEGNGDNPGVFANVEVRAGPIDWELTRDSLAISWLTEVDDQVIRTNELAFVYFDTQRQALTPVLTGGPGNVDQFFDLAIGHFDLPITNCSGEGTSCPKSNLNLQIARMLSTDGNQVDLFIDDVIAAGDPGCSSTEDPPYCLKQTAHPAVIDGIPGVALALTPIDFQGRGIVLGAPIVTRQTTKQPVLVLAVPPMHGERLRVQDFDQNLFMTNPNANKDLLAWMAGSTCDVSMVSDITPDTTCTFNFTIDGNTGNSQYQSTFVEESMGSSESTTDHRFAYSWGGSSTTKVTAQASEGLEVNQMDAYVNTSASVSAGRSNTYARDNISGTYMSSTATSDFATAFDDTVVYMTATENVYRYPMLGQTCSPDGGNSGCTADWTGLQYYTMSIPDQPTTVAGSGKSLEWFQPAWVPGNVFTYPINCASVVGMYGADAKIDNPYKTISNEVGGGDGSFERAFSLTSDTITNTTRGHHIFNDDSVSVTAGVGCVEKPDGDGAQVMETGNFQDTRDRSTLTSNTTTTSGSSAVTTKWTDSLNWQQTEQFVFSSQFILNGLTSNFESEQVQSVSTDPTQGADPTDSYIANGAFWSAYTATFGESSEWWVDSNKSDYYAANIDISLALPERLENVPGGTQPGEGTSPVTQCLDNGASQKLQCVRMAQVDTSFCDVWGTKGDYFHMRGLFFSPQPIPPQSSNTMCSTQADCPYGEACISGTCGRCTQDSDCEAPNPGLEPATCTNQTCLSFINGLPSIPGGTGDTVVDGSDVLLGVRVYNSSFEGMPEGSAVKVQIYAQEWDGENRATGADMQPVPSQLVGGATIERPPIDGVPTTPLNDTCDADSASGSNVSFNWVGAFATWDTEGLAPQTPTTYVFWVLAWGEDSSGNLLGELPDHGLCPDGANDCPCPKVDGVPTCTWLTDVKLEPWTNNLGFYRKIFTVLPKSTSEPQPAGQMARGGVYIDGLDIEGVPRRGDKLQVRARLRAQGGPTNAVSATFFERDPALGQALDEEVVSYIPAGERRPVSISYAPAECGEKRLHVEVRDDQGFVTRGSRAIDIPCEETRIEVTRDVGASDIPSEGPWSAGLLTLEAEGSLDFDRSTASITLEDILLTAWGTELVRTSSGSESSDLRLEALRGDGNEMTYRGFRDGVRVDAVVTEGTTTTTVELSFDGAVIDPGLFCDPGNSELVTTRVSIDDGVSTRILLTTEDALRCTGANLVP